VAEKITMWILGFIEKKEAQNLLLLPDKYWR
jgi:hypothetical protein